MLASAAAWGQMAGVRSGVLFDRPTGSVRLVEGVAGSAHLGAAVLEGVEQAWVSPSAKAAVVRGSGGWALVRGFAGDDAEERGLEMEVERVRWSSGGRYVAMAGRERIEVWDVEVLERVAGVDAGEGRDVVSLAVSDGGELAMAWFDGEQTVVESWRQGQWEETGRVAGRGVLAVAGDAVVLAGEGEVVLIRAGQEAWRKRLERRDAPAGIEIVGREVVAAYGGERATLMVWALEGGAEKEVELDAAPEGLERLGGGDGLVLCSRDREDEEIWVAVRRGAEWRAYFVPAGGGR